MKLACFIVAGCIGWFICVSPALAESPSEKPNILLIMVDDLGFADLGCYGSEIETPHLDALAKRGLRFSQFYNTAKCHSSRVSLLTGLYCYQAGNTALSRGVTIAEVLQRAGYFTAMTGKWHLQKQPTDRGFMRYCGHLSGATNFFTGDNTFRLNGEPWSDFDKDFYTTDAFTDYAMKFIDEAVEAGKPFFTYVAYNAPHYPLQAPKENVMKYWDRYRTGWDAIRQARYEKQLELGLFEKPWTLSPRPDEVPAWDSLGDEQKQWEADRMAVYAGMVDRLDINIGKLVAHLRDKELLDNTLIMFCSDNGACPFERTRGRDLKPWDPKAYWTYDVGWAHVGNTPFRWYKQWQHEGGISSPMIVHWPAGLKTQAGTVTHQPAHLIDYMATCIDVGGGQYPQTFDGRDIEPLAGKSMVPIFKGEQRKGHEYLYQQFGPNRALRQGPWKLVSSRSGAWELYDLRSDRTELNDLAAKHPDRVRQMARQWRHIAEQVEQAPKKVFEPVKDRPVPYRFKRQKTKQ